VRRVFQALLLCLAILFGIEGSASGAYVDATTKNRVGVSGPNPNIRTYTLGALDLEPQGEFTILGYDPATGVVFYVRQNPWTKFDPLGLKTKGDYREDMDRAKAWRDEKIARIPGHFSERGRSQMRNRIDNGYKDLMRRAQKGIDGITATARMMEVVTRSQTGSFDDEVMDDEGDSYVGFNRLSMLGAVVPLKFGEHVHFGEDEAAAKELAKFAAINLALYGAGKGLQILGKAGVSGAKGTGTVWDSVKATQPLYEGTAIPRSFELATGNGKVWLHGNATEHMAEYATSMLNRGVSPSMVNMGTQAQMTSLQSAVNAATANGVQYGKLLNVGGWELKFGAPQQSGQLPALIHALPK
jgi:hypothetical protein